MNTPSKIDPAEIARLSTPQKLAAHALLEKKPEWCFIASNQPKADDPLWHLGLRQEARYARSGLLRSVYYVTACNGRLLGGPWGQSEKSAVPEGAEHCPRCRERAAQVIKNKS